MNGLLILVGAFLTVWGFGVLVAWFLNGCTWDEPGHVSRRTLKRERRREEREIRKARAAFAELRRFEDELGIKY